MQMHRLGRETSVVVDNVESFPRLKIDDCKKKKKTKTKILNIFIFNAIILNGYIMK